MSGPVSNVETGAMTLPAIGAPWIEAIDVSEHHCIDFDNVVAHDVGVVVVRAGRGTRQDARWIEHVRAARRSGLHVGSYWHVYPSRTDAHHQAELWMGAIRSTATRMSCGHWADVDTTDGLNPEALGRYIAAFLARTPGARELDIAGQPGQPTAGLKTSHGRQLLPQVDGHDGFYYAKLIKVAATARG